MPRATIAETEAQIEADFNKALEMMTNNSTTLSAGNKTELNIPSLKALMSRYYLYKGDYAKVRQLTNEIVASTDPAFVNLVSPSTTTSKPSGTLLYTSS